MSHPVSDAWFFRVKSATRDLVDACGGIERSAVKCNASKSEVGRWRATTEVTIIPLTAVLALEADCGVAHVTSVMAALNGRRVVDDSEATGGDARTVVRHHAEVMRAVGDMTVTAASALEDGLVTPAEAEQLDRAAGELEARVGALRLDLSAAKGPRLVTVAGGR